MILSLLTPPAALPVDLGAAKAHLRVMSEAEDAVIASYLAAAVAEIDGPSGLLGLCLTSQVWRLQMAAWVGPVALPVEPVQSVAVSFVDAGGNAQVLAASSYALASGVNARPVLYWRGEMPALGPAPWPVTVDITAGFGTLPDDLRVAILMRTADFYTNREAQATGAMNENAAFDGIIARNRKHF